MKEIQSTINLDDVIKLLEEEKTDVKVEINTNGETNVMVSNASGYDDTICTQNFLYEDFEEFDNVEDYQNWIESCYDSVGEIEIDNEIEENEYLLTIKIA